MSKIGVKIAAGNLPKAGATRGKSRSLLDMVRAAFRDQESLHQQILNSVTDYAIVASDLEGRVTSWNEGARRILGWTEEEMLGQPVDRFFTPEDVASGQPVKEMQTAYDKGYADDVRWHQRKGGERFWANGKMTPLKDDAGAVTGFVKVMRDQTEQRRAEEHQRLLVHELNHRVKNTLATVQALAGQAFQGTGQNEARGIFEARLFALAQAHDLLTHTNWEGADLPDLIAKAVAPYQREAGGRFEIEGPNVWVRPRIALALSMALHELATNAAKYGALSVPSGRIVIRWAVISGDLNLLSLQWQEKEGPPVTPPTRKGFGTRLIERSLALELGGEVNIAYEPSGVVCTLATPMDDEYAA
jgi:PAS domain S-box-containing protein